MKEEYYQSSRTQHSFCCPAVWYNGDIASPPDYTKLTDVEFDVMMRVLGKSKDLKGQGKTRREETEVTGFG